MSFPARQLEQVNVVDSPLEPEMVASVVDVFVAIRFSLRCLFAWVRFEVDVDMPANVFEIRQSWRDVDTEVRARLGVSEPDDDGYGCYHETTTLRMG